MNRRLELVAPNKPMVITEKPIPEPPDNGYIVKVLYAGVCLTDVHLAHGTLGHKSPKNLPLVLGHEISGEIYKIGEEAVKARPDVKVGQKVVVYAMVKCSTCVDCMSDRTCYCRGGLTDRTLGRQVDGGFQQYVLVHDSINVFPVADNFPLDMGAISACSGLTAWNAVSKVRETVDQNLAVRGKATILVVGSGGLGHWVVELCKHMWPTHAVRICAVDVLDEKLEDIKRVGADMVYRWDKDAPDVEVAVNLVEFLGSRVDAALDFTGITSSAKRIFHTLDSNSTWAIVGVHNDVMPDISLVDIAVKSINIRGVLVGSRQQYSELLEFVAANKINGPPIEHITLDKVQETLTIVGSGQQRGRAVVKFSV